MERSFAMTRRGHAFERLKNALENQGVDQRNAYALVALDERGNVRVHASGPIKGYLDELQLETQYQRAIELATHESSVTASQSGALISWAEGIEAANEADVDDSISTVETRPQARIKARRGRSLLPRAPYPLHEQAIRETAPMEPEYGPPMPRLSTRKTLKTFRIDDPEAVTRFLATRLKRMQQLADKKIAKAWIKGICPKKQAKFPYQNQKRKLGGGVSPTIPAWWPAERCRFTEPDHIRREERMELCLHLLRLRPTPAQLKAWNHHDTDPNPTHVKEGWTAFLSELAGPEIFDDLPREPPEKTKMRQTLMAQMYQVARMEEEYLDGARDGDDMFSHEEDEEDRKYVASSKRARAKSTVSLSDVDERRSDSASCAPVKRARTDSSPVSALHDEHRRPTADQKHDVEMLDLQTPQPTHHHMLPGSVPFTDREESRIQDPLRQQGPSVQQRRHTTGVNMASRNGPAQYEDTAQALPRQRDQQTQLSPGQWVDQSASAQFGQQFSGVETYHPQPAATNFPVKQNYEVPQYHSHSQNQIQVHQVGHVPQPEFHCLPASPLFSPSSAVLMPLNGYPMHAEQPGAPQPHYGASMPPSQFFMPAHSDPAVADFQPQMCFPQPSYHPQHTGLAPSHVVPMQFHGLSFPHPGA